MNIEVPEPLVKHYKSISMARELISDLKSLFESVEKDDELWESVRDKVNHALIALDRVKDRREDIEDVLDKQIVSVSMDKFAREVIDDKEVQDD